MEGSRNGGATVHSRMPRCAAATAALLLVTALLASLVAWAGILRIHGAGSSSLTPAGGGVLSGATLRDDGTARALQLRGSPDGAESPVVGTATSPPIAPLARSGSVEEHASGDGGVRALSGGVPPLQCTGTLPRAEGAVDWAASTLQGAGVKQSVFLSCPTAAPHNQVVELRWCTVVTEAESKQLPQGMSAWWVRLDVSHGAGGKVSVKHPGCADVRPNNDEMSVHVRLHTPL